MISIYYTIESLQIVALKDRISCIRINHRFIQEENLSETLLIDGEYQVQGFSAINAYLDNVEIFTENWYQESCDKDHSNDVQPVQN